MSLNKAVCCALAVLVTVGVLQYVGLSFAPEQLLSQAALLEADKSLSIDTRHANIDSLTDSPVNIDLESAPAPVSDNFAADEFAPDATTKTSQDNKISDIVSGFVTDSADTLPAPTKHDSTTNQIVTAALPELPKVPDLPELPATSQLTEVESPSNLSDSASMPKLPEIPAPEQTELPKTDNSTEPQSEWEATGASDLSDPDLTPKTTSSSLFATPEVDNTKPESATTLSLPSAQSSVTAANSQPTVASLLVTPGKTATINNQVKTNTSLSTTATSITPDQLAVTHTVQSGDTLSKIALKYYGSSRYADDIFAANSHKLSSPDRLARGLTLIIPAEAAKIRAGREVVAVPLSTATSVSAAATTSSALTRNSQTTEKIAYRDVTAGSTYIVKAGDTLYGIAEEKLGNGNDWQKIYNANRHLLKKPDQLKVGMQLVIPQ